MASFEILFKNYALAGLLIFALLAFVIGFQEDNDAPQKLIEDPLLNGSFSDLSDTLSVMRDKSQSQRELFEKEPPTAGFGSLILFSIVSSGKVFTGITIGLFNVLFKLPTIVFGLDPIVSSVLSTILIISVILGLWSLYKLGG